MTEIERAEMTYWWHVIYEYMCKRADWLYAEDATKGLLDGAFNQEYIDDNIRYPVLRWRQLKAKEEFSDAKN